MRQSEIDSYESRSKSSKPTRTPPIYHIYIYYIYIYIIYINIYIYIYIYNQSKIDRYEQNEIDTSLVQKF